MKNYGKRGKKNCIYDGHSETLEKDPEKRIDSFNDDCFETLQNWPSCMLELVLREFICTFLALGDSCHTLSHFDTQIG